MRSHLIVAGVGSAALVALAGTGIWMIMPSETGREILSRMENAPRMASAVAAPAPADDAVGANSNIKVPEAAAAVEAQATDVKGDRPFSVQRPKSAPATNQVPINPAPLASSSPRWSHPDGQKDTGAVIAVAKAGAEAGQRPEPVPGSDLVAAYVSGQADAAKPSKSSGSAKKDEPAPVAVASIKPEKPTAKANNAAAAKADDNEKAEGRGTRVTQGVTLRAKPDNDGSALLTIPAKSQVQVVSCKGWCEVVYNGKRGYVYKKFLQNGGKT